MTKKTLQQYADEMFDEIGLPQLKQPLKTIEEAFAAHGWTINISGDRVDFKPDTLRIGMTAIARTTYEFYDPETGKFARDVTGPLGENFMAPDGVDEPERRDVQGTPASVAWVVGTRAPNDVNGNDPIEQTLAPVSTLKKEIDDVMNGVLKELSKPQPMAGVAAGVA